MPIYEKKKKKTDQYEEHLVSISEYDQFAKDNPHLQRAYLKAPNLNKGGVGDRTKAPDGFKEVLSKISDANPNSNLASDYGKKDHKSVAVRNAVQKVTKKLGDKITKSE